MDIQELVDQALDKWDNETSCGETDPAFSGEVEQDIDKLVDGLSQENVEKLLAVKNPVIFVEGE